MTSRERVLTAIDRRLPDRTPADYKAEPEVNKYMMKHLKVNSYEELLQRLQSDIRRLEPRYIGPEFKPDADGVFEDYWGIRSKHLKAYHGSYDMHLHTPLWDAESLDDMKKHKWPTPDLFDYSVMREQCARARQGGYAIMYEGADLFTRPCILRNMENVLLDMVERPEMAHFLFEQFTRFYCEDAARAMEATGGGFDIYGEWSDYGTQRALLMSVPMFREFITPYLQRLDQRRAWRRSQVHGPQLRRHPPSHPRPHRHGRGFARPGPGRRRGDGTGRPQAGLRRQDCLPWRHLHPAHPALRHSARGDRGRSPPRRHLRRRRRLYPGRQP